MGAQLQIIKTFQELSDYLWQEKTDLMELCFENLQNLSDFDRGEYKGQAIAFDEILQLLRHSIKYEEL